MITAENLAIGYQDKLLLQNISFTLKPGLHVLLGANGSGKTTLLKTIAGLIKPIKGKILVDGLEPHRLRRKEAARLIAYTWQNPYYGFIEARVEDEIKFILRTTGVEGDWSIVEKLVPEELMDRDPFTLSGGEAKRVSLASVLVADQPVWLLDEPFNELDSDGIEKLFEIIRDARSRGKTIVVATHLVTLMDALSPDNYLLITRDKTIAMGEWNMLTDEMLEESNVLSRRMICGGNRRSI